MWPNQLPMGLGTWGNITFWGHSPLGADSFSPLAKFTTVKMALPEFRCTNLDKIWTSKIKIWTKNNFLTKKIFFTNRACGLHEKKSAEKWKISKKFFVFLISVLLTITTQNFVEIWQLWFFDPYRPLKCDFRGQKIKVVRFQRNFAW